MSRDIWIVSDTHFGHANILKFVDSKTGIPVRGDRFANVDEMNEHMIEK
jgi:calcineurin-like phosphoesterase family protein